jgi:Domain of unknown function DUF29
MATNLAELYDRDRYAWALGQAGELRQLAETRPNLPIDFEHLIDEVEGLALSDLNTVLSQLERLVYHLLKLEHSPSPRPRRGWLNTVDNARREIGRHYTSSMRAKVEEEIEPILAVARRAARRDLLDRHEREAADALPRVRPYDLDRLLDPDWFPPNRHGIIDAD